MNSTDLQTLIDNGTTNDPHLAELLQMSMMEDVFVQINEVSAMLIKGIAYEERIGKVVQLKALNAGNIIIEDEAYLIKDAVISPDSYMSYDMRLEKADGSGVLREMQVDGRAVRKMVARKTTVMDLAEDHELVDNLNDVNPDQFTINGKKYWIAGEEWTQTKPGYRDLVLIPVGRSGNQTVIKTISEKLIQNLIDTGRTSFRLSEEGDCLDLDR